MELPRLRELAERLVTVDGIVGVTLGGSRARGTARPDSDVDLGLYYRPPLDTTALRALARGLADAREPDAVPELTEPGDWGPWVDGGGWLRIDGVDVDWLYRDLDRVRRSAEDARSGRVGIGFQVGHPFGVPSFAYAGELAVGVVLADPTGELAELRSGLDPYPPALARAQADALWEADFLLGSVAKPAGRGDTTMVAGVLFRVVVLCAHAVAARAGWWVINEKGLVEVAGRLPGAPDGFARRAHGVLAALGETPEQLGTAVAAATALVRECRT